MRAVTELWFALRPCPACLVRPTTRDGVCGRCRARWLDAAAARPNEPFEAAFPALGAPDLVALGAYRGDLGRLVRAAKYRPDRRLLGRIGTALGQRVRELVAGDPGALRVVPVPGDRRRVRRRGLDHAQVLARAVAAVLERPSDLRCDLRRVRRTRPQARLTDAERSANLTGAIAWRGDGLARATVILVDDVLTTGATARACRAALIDAGAGRVIVAVAARAR